MIESDLTHYKRLNVYNPLDHLRLLEWLLFKPARLREYKSSFGDRSVERVGAWTFSTLFWLPHLMITAAFALGVLTIDPIYSSSTPSPESQALIISGCMLLAWLMTGWVGAHRGREYNIFQSTVLLILMLIACFCTGFPAFWINWSITFKTIFGVTEDMGLVTLLRLMSLLAFVIPVSFASALVHYLGSREGILMSWVLRVILWVGAAASSFLILLLIVGWSSPPLAAAHIAAMLVTLALLLLFALPLLITPVLRFLGQKRLPRSVLLLTNFLLIIILVASYAMLAWVSFLGGWETINSLAGYS
jgi:hypothetical protein